MKNTVWLCTFSAFLGAVIAIGLWQHFLAPSVSASANFLSSAKPIAAVEPITSVGLGPSFPMPPDAAANPMPPQDLVQPQVPAAPLTPVVPVGANPEYTPEEAVNIAVYEKVNRSVVNIDTQAVKVDNFFMLAVPTEGAGSGWVLDRDGHIVTNNHVIAESDSIQVTLADGSAFPARLVGTDPATDIAVLKIDAPPELLFPVEFGESANLRVGQRVFAIGNPYGLERTMTVGIVSSLNRTLASGNNQKLKNMIQLDAALNQGNSGGPLLDSRGRLIGMNTAIASMTGQNSGVGFAVPANVIRRTVPELLQFGKVVRASLGIEAIMEMRRGVMIAKTEKNGAAEQAGLRGGYREAVERFGTMQVRRQFFDRQNADVILKIDDIEVKSADDINDIVGERKPGEEVVVTILRAGREAVLRVRLGSE